jgi:hypothetical protein
LSRSGAVLVATSLFGVFGASAAVAEPGATVGALARKVQARPAKEPWTPVASGAVLSVGSGLRTLDRSSAELRLDAGGRVILTELTTVTLRGSRSIVLAAGQLDAELPAEAAPIELESGIVRISVRASGGPALARLRVQEGKVQAMSFAGAVRVESTGAAPLELAAGSGASVGASAAEKLLPAPVTSVPASGAAPDHANPRLWWEDVPGAGSYTVEVCRDEACAETEDRGAGVVGAPWAPEGLPLGDLYWRVCSTSPSGLDSPPSRAVRFTIRSLWRKPHPRPRT